jgi:carbon-monoxide dehydrogenase medium subunit
MLRLGAGVCESVRLVAFGVGDGPVRLVWAERLLLDSAVDVDRARKAAEAAAAGLPPPPSDVHASAEYRRHLVAFLTEQVLLEAQASAN